MKVKELIKQLMDADPTGNEEVVVNNIDIHFVEELPGYYDGAYQILHRDESKKDCWNITGGEYRRSGSKIQIHTLAISDILDRDVQIDYSKIGNKALEKKYFEADEKTRQQYKNIHIDCEWSNFKEWLKEKASEISGDPMDYIVARDFFDENIDPNCPLPIEKTEAEKLGQCLHDSYVNRRKLQWNNTIEIEYLGMDWSIKFKEGIK